MTYDGVDRRSNDIVFAKQIGKMEAKLARVDKDVDELHRDVKSLLALANQQSGGWKTIMLVAGVAGTLGALVTKIGIFIPK